MVDGVFHDSDVAVVVAPKELLVGNRIDFKNYLLRQGETRHVLIDLQHCEYIDSSALGTLLAVSREFRKSGKNLGLFGHSGDFQTLFELTRIDQVIYVSREAKANLKTLRGVRSFEPAPAQTDEDDYQPPDLKLLK